MSGAKLEFAEERINTFSNPSVVRYFSFFQNKVSPSSIWL